MYQSRVVNVERELVFHVFSNCDYANESIDAIEGNNRDRGGWKMEILFCVMAQFLQSNPSRKTTKMKIEKENCLYQGKFRCSVFTCAIVFSLVKRAF